VRWPDTISNKELWRKTKQQPINLTIRSRRWTWIRHTLRKANNNITKQALEWNPQGKRKRGRPKNSWRRGIISELQAINTTWGEAKWKETGFDSYHIWQFSLFVLLQSNKDGKKVKINYYLMTICTFFL
jgi:hypothetical protein